MIPLVLSNREKSQRVGKIIQDSFLSHCDEIKGMRGAKKYPVRLANMIGTKYEKPVMVESNMVVLIGVLVTQELMAAIQLIIARGKFTDGKI